MKDKFGFDYWKNLSKEWAKMAAEAHQSGYHHLRNICHAMAVQANHNAEECL